MLKDLEKYVPVSNSIDWGLIKSELMKPFVQEMMKTHQEPRWHEEGDVWTHTTMVCEALIQMKEYQELDSLLKLEVFIAALFHDVAKPICTRVIDGVITSYNHTIKGAIMTREYLWKEYGLAGDLESQRVRETICLLIRYHSRPLHLEDDGENNLVKISSNQALAGDFSLKLLGILAKADVIGRISSDQESHLNKIEDFNQTAQLMGCYEQAITFKNDISRFHYLNGKEMWIEQELFDDTWGEVILLCGLPGTGKDYYIQTHYPSMNVISLDEIREELHILPSESNSRVYSVAKERAKELLRKKIPFIWNATSLTPFIRKHQIDLFHQYHAKARIIFLETSWKTNLTRNESRDRRVPRRIIEEMLATLQVPEAYEAEIVEWMIS